MKQEIGALVIGLAFGIAASSPVLAADEPTGDLGTLTKEKAATTSSARPYSPYAGRNFPSRRRSLAAQSCDGRGHHGVSV